MIEDLFFRDHIPSKSMEDPFFNSFNPHTYAPPPRRSPQATRTPPSPPLQQPVPKQRKVVSIPVHHVESDNKRSESAIKIQKAFRGFRVRKTVRKILELKREVDAVERMLLEEEAMAVIRKNSLEKLKVNESLMALLFKLDSIRGIDGGVREFRKAVITKALMLQEIVDAAVDDNDEKSRKVQGFSGENRDCCEEIEKLTENFEDSSRISAENLGEITGETLGNEAEDDEMESLDDSSTMQVEKSEEIGYDNETLEKIVMKLVNSEKTCNEIGYDNETLEKIEGIVNEEPNDACNEMQVESRADNNAESWECVDGETKEQKFDENGGAENSETRRDSGKESLNQEWCVIGSGHDGQEKEKEKNLLEKMAEDNQKLMSMVADLCEKNATQTRLICSLSQRVEQLEKTMNDDKLRKKKKKKTKCNSSLTHL